MRTKTETKERKPRLLQHVVERYLSSRNIPNKKLSSLELIKFLNVCSYEVSDDDKIKWITKFLVAQGLKVPSLTSAILIQKGGICYLFNEGYTLESITKEELTKQFFTCSKKKETCEEVPKPTITKEEKKIKERDFSVNQAVLDIDTLIDLFIKNKKTKLELPSSFTALSTDGILLVQQEPAFLSLKKELTLALSSPLSDYHEAYSNFTDLQKKRLLEFITKLLSFKPVVISQQKREPRKTKKPRAIIIEQKLKHFNPCPSWNNIPSVPVKAIFSATSLLLFNSKQETLILVSSIPGTHFDISRTSIINIDETQIVVKRLDIKKQPLEEFCLGNLKTITNKLTGLKSSTKTFSGRCSGDYLIFRAWT